MKTIAILTNGFVFVGDVTVKKDWIEIENTYNIRRFGTTKGLGQLAVEGIQKDTVLDKVGVLRAPVSNVIGLIDAPKVKL